MAMNITHGLRYQVTNTDAGNSIAIVAEENILPFVHVSRDENSISIGLTGSIESNEGILVIINNKELEHLLVKDGAEGDVLITDCERVQITVMGGSDMNLIGNTEALNLFVKGGSQLEGRPR